MGVWRQAAAACGGHRWSWVVEKKVLGFGWAFELVNLDKEILIKDFEAKLFQ